MEYKASDNAHEAAWAHKAERLKEQCALRFETAKDASMTAQCATHGVGWKTAKEDGEKLLKPEPKPAPAADSPV